MFSCLYNSSLWAMFLSVILFGNTWLEMRVNLGLVFFGLIAVIFVIIIALRPLRYIFGTFKASALSLVAVSFGLFYILGTERLAVIPASIVREGIMQSRIQFSTINIIIISGALIGLMISYLLRTKNHEH